MPRRWKPPKEERTDSETIRRAQRFQEDIGEILENGTEDDFVALLKAEKPDMGKEELKALIMQFRVYVREKRGLC